MALPGEERASALPQRLYLIGPAEKAINARSVDRLTIGQVAGTRFQAINILKYSFAA
jgi:hypothetical protein